MSLFLLDSSCNLPTPYEKYIFNRDEEFIAEVKRQGHSIHVIDYLRFSQESITQLTSSKEPVIFRGSLNLGKDILRRAPYTPGAYMNEQKLNCMTYYAYFGKHLLNNEYYVMPLAEVMRRRQTLAYDFCDKRFFIRPVSNMKTFHAGVFDMKDDLNTLEKAKSRLRCDETTLVLVAQPQPLLREWRFFMYKNRVITGSQYLKNDAVDCGLVTEKDQYLADYVHQVMRDVQWYPETLWSLDICEVDRGSDVDTGRATELKVLELGSYSCAGEYDIDLSLYVEAGVRAAIEDWEKVQA